jgi:hypothetical protein
MYYFTTNSDGKDWLGRQWAVGTSFTEENPNYWFLCYDHPLVALLMNPGTDQYKNPRVWLAELGADKLKYDYRFVSKEMKLLQEVEVVVPTLAQRQAFGIVCALNTVTNQMFSEWGLGWLRGRDRSQERAQQLAEELLEQMFLDYVGPGHAACACVGLNEPELYASCAAARAYYDSLGTEEEPGEPLDLGQIATIVTMLPPEEIGVMLGGEDGGREIHPGSEGVGLQQTSIPDGQQAGPTQNLDSGGPTDVRHGCVLSGSEGGAAEVPANR